MIYNYIYTSNANTSTFNGNHTSTSKNVKCIMYWCLFGRFSFPFFLLNVLIRFTTFKSAHKKQWDNLFVLHNRIHYIFMPQIDCVSSVSKINLIVEMIILQVQSFFIFFFLFSIRLKYKWIYKGYCYSL